MKAKVIRGKGFGGLVRYVLSKKKNQPEKAILATNLSGSTADELTQEFAISYRLRPDIKRPVWHSSLSLPEGEVLSDEDWAEAIDRFLKKMAIDPEKHMFLAVRHRDTAYDHAHLVVSRVGLDSSVWHGKWEARAAIQATEELEEELDLIQTKPFAQNRTGRKRLKNSEQRMAQRLREKPARLELQEILDSIKLGNLSVEEFVGLLKKKGVSATPNIASTGRMSGFSFRYNGIAFKGSQLGKKYAWQKLRLRLLQKNKDLTQS